MGTDIHGVWQKRVGDTWQDIESNYTQERHYQLFAALAGVRNGVGFAGIQTGEPVAPISEPRGLPDDFMLDADEEASHTVPDEMCLDPRRREWRQQAGETDLAVYMGDHSFSWLTSDEMLAWYEMAPTVIKTGVLSRESYEAWDKKSSPDSYSGGVWGRDVVTVKDSEVAKRLVPGWTHIECEWEESLKHELSYFFEEVQRLKLLHGDVRFVFGFDS